MGYTFTWKDIEKICRKLGMKRQGKSSVWTGVGPKNKNYYYSFKTHWQ